MITMTSRRKPTSLDEAADMLELALQKAPNNSLHIAVNAANPGCKFAHPCSGATGLLGDLLCFYPKRFARRGEMIVLVKRERSSAGLATVAAAGGAAMPGRISMETVVDQEAEPSLQGLLSLKQARPPSVQDARELTQASAGDAGGSAAGTTFTDDESGSQWDMQVYWDGAESFLNTTPAKSKGLRPALFLENEGRYGEFGFFGRAVYDSLQDETGRGALWLNTEDPFCIVAVGVQGSGKSHTTSVVAENCLLHQPSHPIIRLQDPMAAVVFHWDNDPLTFCELVTLAQRHQQHTGNFLEGITVLTSPCNLKKRRQYYKDFPNCKVEPVLFRWQDMDASLIKVLMRIAFDDDKMPLYMSNLLAMLRRYQRNAQLPTFTSFVQGVSEELGLIKSQEGPIKQRLTLLEQFVWESDENKDLRDEAGATGPVNLRRVGGGLVIVDLTDPMLEASEANAVFAVLLQQFMKNPVPRKLTIFDEAHKYISAETGPLQAEIRKIVKIMRHKGTRVVISTQSPCDLPSDILELCSMCIMHQFQAHKWFSHLKHSLPLTDHAFEEIVNLPPGEALVFVRQMAKLDLGAILGPGSLARKAPRGSAETPFHPIVNENQEKHPGYAEPEVQSRWGLGGIKRRTLGPGSSARKPPGGSVETPSHPTVQENQETHPGYAGPEVQSRWGLGVIKMRIRPRLTADGGATVHSTAR